MECEIFSPAIGFSRAYENYFPKKDILSRAREYYLPLYLKFYAYNYAPSVDDMDSFISVFRIMSIHLNFMSFAFIDIIVCGHAEILMDPHLTYFWLRSESLKKIMFSIYPQESVNKCQLVVHYCVSRNNAQMLIDFIRNFGISMEDIMRCLIDCEREMGLYNGYLFVKTIRKYYKSLSG